jgi:hypothetical protein
MNTGVSREKVSLAVILIDSDEKARSNEANMLVQLPTLSDATLLVSLAQYVG